VTLTAHLDFGSIDEEWSDIGQLGHLFAAGFLHKGVAIDTGNTPERVRARFPISLESSLMATETGFILDFGRLARVFAKGDHAANALAAAGGNMGAPRAVTIFAGPFFRLIARVEQENFPHHGLGKFFKGGRVASLANFIADIGGRGRLRWFCFRRPDNPKRKRQE
jgi:hypothetical protein